MTQIPEVTDALNTIRCTILGALDDYGDHGGRALTLAGLNKHTGMPRETLRGIIADLRADGLAVYVRGLWGYDGRPVGAGYAITGKGLAYVASVTKGGAL